MAKRLRAALVQADLVGSVRESLLDRLPRLQDLVGVILIDIVGETLGENDTLVGSLGGRRSPGDAGTLLRVGGGQVARLGRLIETNPYETVALRPAPCCV